MSAEFIKQELGRWVLNAPDERTEIVDLDDYRTWSTKSLEDEARGIRKRIYGLEQLQMYIPHSIEYLNGVLVLVEMQLHDRKKETK